MEYEIKNQFLNVKINSRGAELASVKSVNSDTEFLWQADPEVWNRHAPILFPIVGRLKNDTYQYQGKSYQLSQHGFARDKEFKLLSQENDAISLVLRDDEASLKEYPCLLYTSPSPRDNARDLVCRLLLEKKKKRKKH